MSLATPTQKMRTNGAHLKPVILVSMHTEVLNLGHRNGLVLGLLGLWRRVALPDKAARP